MESRLKRLPWVAAFDEMKSTQWLFDVPSEESEVKTGSNVVLTRTVIPTAIMFGGGRTSGRPALSSERCTSKGPYFALAGRVHGGLFPDPLLMAPRKTGW